MLEIIVALSKSPLIVFIVIAVMSLITYVAIIEKTRR